VGSRAGLDMMVKRKNCCLCQELMLGHPACNLVTTLIELSLLLFVCNTNIGRNRVKTTLNKNI
jgi:hypothetical protein